MLPDLTGNPKWAVPTQKQSAFLAATVKEREQYMRKDLAASGLEPKQIRAYVTDLMPLHKDAKGGYYIPYFDLDGNIMRSGGELSMYRIRQYGSKHRYIQPTTAELDALGIPPNPPYILPRVHDLLEQGAALHICEGEKKAAATMNVLDLPCIGIGGCWNWGIKKRLHPWIKELVGRYGVERVVVVPDGDIKRYDICTAYGTLADELRRLGVEVEIVVLPNPEDKIDDLLLEWGIEAEGLFNDLGKLQSAELVVSQSALAEQYGLSTSGRDQRVAINDSNVYKLLEHHPAFGEFWVNTDTDTVMMDNEPVRWDYTDNTILRYMQHYFQLHSLTQRSVSSNLRALAETTKRSEWLEWVGRVPWDGTERLATWAIDMWGCPDTPATREVSEKFMVGMAARLLQPGCKMDWMLVTVGAQGIGKSWWAELVSGGHHVAFMASGNARDDAAKIHKGMVILIDELDAFNKREMTYWKTMLTTTEDTYRAPYARAEESKPRSSVLYGTSNHDTFLRHDSTGQRRFGVLKPTRMLDVDAFKGALQQLWAEAMAKAELGELRYYELSMETREAVAGEHQGEDPYMERIEQFLISRQNDRFKMLELLEFLGQTDHMRNRSITGPLKDLLVGLGCEYKKMVRIKGHPPGSGYIIDRERYPYDPESLGPLTKY